MILNVVLRQGEFVLYLDKMIISVFGSEIVTSSVPALLPST